MIIPSCDIVQPANHPSSAVK
uniref:Uncharacterized protein n=1 Tax=Arundo donax TaxID=35708 RepID=A0A0A9B5J7_ARUDO